MNLVNKIISHYRIVSRLGAGGMGEVYLAHDSKLDRKVALKILPGEVASNRERMERFVREAKAAAALNHPNIAHIYEIGEDYGTHFIAMEFIEGKTLRELIHERKTTLPKLLLYLRQAADGLVKAHAAGIVHRDLKPDNVMVTQDGYAKIVDFGLAKLLEKTNHESSAAMSEAATAIMPAQHSTPGVVMGTAGYMSPEQARCRPVDERSDIFSFGCILYEAASGRRPFEGDTIVATLHKIIYEAAPAISEFNPSVPPDLQRIVRKCLVKEPDKRYQTIRDVGNDLEDLLEELRGIGDLGRSVPPSASVTASGAVRSTDAGVVASESTARPSTSAASSAEYIVRGIARHKRAFILALGALLITTAVAVYLLFERSGSAAIDSIAVLPFVNASSDPNTEYLSDGISEALINSLTELQQLKVIARSTAFGYKGKKVEPETVGRELKVQTVLMGQVRLIADRMSIQVDLVNATTGAQLWGESYESKASDVLSVKQTIAREVTERLRLRLSGGEQRRLVRRDTTNPEAYQFYLRGRYYWNRRTAEGIGRALQEFQQATQLDPDYALGYVGFADCYLLLEQYGGMPTSEVLPKARAAISRALQIDDSLPEAHTTLASVYKAQWEWAKAEEEYKLAIKLNPNYPTAHHWLAIFYLTTGRVSDAMNEMSRAYELDPLSPIIGATLGMVHLWNGNPTAASELCKRVLEIDPNFPSAHLYLGWAHFKQERTEEAIAELQRAVELSGRADFYLTDLGYMYAATGKRDQAAQILKELEEKYARREAIGCHLAAVYGGLGQLDKAYAWLEKDYEQRNSQVPDITWWFIYDELRKDPSYVDLVRRMGLEP